MILIKTIPSTSPKRAPYWFKNEKSSSSSMISTISPYRNLSELLSFSQSLIFSSYDHIPWLSSLISCNCSLMENCKKKNCCVINRRLCWCGQCRLRCFHVGDDGIWCFRNAWRKKFHVTTLLFFFLVVSCFLCCCK